jgi:hypothetical protein
MLHDHPFNDAQITVQVDGARELAGIKPTGRFRELMALVSEQGEGQAEVSTGARDLPNAMVAIAPARRLGA